MISYRNIDVAFQGKQILENTGLDLKAGKVTLIYGKSGSGKTTLFYHLAFIGNNGETISGNILHGEIDRIRRQDIAFVMQNNVLMSWLTVEENLYEYAAMAGTNMNKSRVCELLKLVNLDVPLDQKCSLLSLGERERLCIACALSKDAKMIILDEPTASLDLENKIMIFQLIRRIAAQGKYVVFSSHEEQAAEYADDVWRINGRTLLHEKDSGEEETNIIEAVHVNGFLTFLKTHNAHYRLYNRILQVLNTSLIMITVICSALVLSLYKENLNNTRKTLFESSDKYLYVTDNKNEGYADKDIYPVDIDEGYPIYAVRALLAEPVAVIPYYDETDYSNKIYSYLSSQPHGIYLSSDASEQISSTGAIPEKISLKLLGDEGIKEMHTVINGILKQGVKAYELYDEDCYIAIWHEDYEALFTDEPVGRLKFYDSYEQLKQDREKYLIMGYKVNDKASSYEHVLEITEKEQTIYERLKMIFLCISIVLLSSMHFFSVRRRIREFSILRMNGIPVTIIVALFAIEQLPAVSLTIATGAILSCVMEFIKISCWDLFVTSFLTICMIYIMLYIGTALYLSVYRIDRVLRE